jgi:hypothetical protein
MNGRIACGSMVLLLSFSRKCGSRSHIFVKKDVQFHPAGGDMSFRVRDRVTRVIYIMYTTYAVGLQTGRLIRYTAASPAAAWYSFSFAQKNSQCGFFCAKDPGSSACRFFWRFCWRSHADFSENRPDVLILRQSVCLLQI